MCVRMILTQRLLSAVNVDSVNASKLLRGFRVRTVANVVHRVFRDILNSTKLFGLSPDDARRSSGGSFPGLERVNRWMVKGSMRSVNN